MPLASKKGDIDYVYKKISLLYLRPRSNCLWGNITATGNTFPVPGVLSGSENSVCGQAQGQAFSAV